MHHDCPIMFEELFAQRGLSLERLKSFAEIVAAGGITAAAHDDASRQSQLSRQLKELERHFGVELLRRGRGPMKLTEAGQQLHRVIGHTFGALEEFQRDCVGRPVELSIGAGESLIQWLLLPRLPRFAAAQPRVTVSFRNLRTDDILQGLADGTLDFGVVARFPSHRAFKSVPLGRLDYALFVPVALPSAKPSVTLLGRVPLALLEGGETIQRVLDRLAHAHELKLDVRLRLTSYPQLVTAVRQQHVAAFLPVLAAEAFPPGSVRMVKLPFMAELARSLSLVWNPQVAEIRPAVAAHAKVLAGAFSKAA